MPFEAGKTIKELGIDPTKEFIVVNAEGRTDLSHGDILTLKKDDNSSNPFFICKKTLKTFYCPLSRLEYLPPHNPIKKSLTEKIMSIFKKEPNKSLIKAGLMGEDEMPTDYGVKCFVAMLLQDKATADRFKSEVADQIISEKED